MQPRLLVPAVEFVGPAISPDDLARLFTAAPTLRPSWFSGTNLTVHGIPMSDATVLALGLASFRQPPPFAVGDRRRHPMRFIVLRQTGLTDTAAGHLVEAIASMPADTFGQQLHVDLSGNALTDSGAARWSDSVAVFARVHTLLLSHNAGIGARGSARLFAAVGGSPSLVRFEYRNNHVEDAAIRAFVQRAAANGELALDTLDLSYAHAVTDEGARALASFLRRQRRIGGFALYAEDMPMVTQRGRSRLVEAFASNREHVRALHLAPHVHLTAGSPQWNAAMSPAARLGVSLTLLRPAATHLAFVACNEHGAPFDALSSADDVQNHLLAAVSEMDYESASPRLVVEGNVATTAALDAILDAVSAVKSIRGLSLVHCDVFRIPTWYRRLTDVELNDIHLVAQHPPADPVPLDASLWHASLALRALSVSGFRLRHWDTLLFESGADQDDIDGRDSTRFPFLRTLHLRNTPEPLPTVLLQRLLDAGRLVELDLSHTGLDAATNARPLLEALARGQTASLERLNLSGNPHVPTATLRAALETPESSALTDVIDGFGHSISNRGAYDAHRRRTSVLARLALGPPVNTRALCATPSPWLPDTDEYQEAIERRRLPIQDEISLDDSISPEDVIVLRDHCWSRTSLLAAIQNGPSGPPRHPTDGDEWSRRELWQIGGNELLAEVDARRASDPDV